MNGIDFFQTLPNISCKDSNLKTLKDKSKFKFGNFKRQIKIPYLTLAAKIQIWKL
jgi:hypothetical protein